MRARRTTARLAARAAPHAVSRRSSALATATTSNLNKGSIHPTAIVEPGCRLGKDVNIGPYCVVGSDVTLGDAVRLDSHVRVDGHTTIGASSSVQSFATVGATPQDLKYSGEPSVLHVGERCRIFEYAHLSGGTAAGGGVTSIGDDCLLMSNTHVAHDCVLASNVILASSAALAGHVHVGRGARISGYSCVHQNVSVGQGAFLGGGSVLVSDLIPYGLAVGNRASLHGLNLRGLRRESVPLDELRTMLSCFRYLFEQPDEGYYKPLPLPHRQTIGERASLCAEDDGYARYPMLREMVRFVLGRRTVAAAGGAAGSASSSGANRDDGGGELVGRSLCRPP